MFRYHRNGLHITVYEVNRSPRERFEASFILNGVIVDRGCGPTEEHALRAMWYIVQAHTEVVSHV
jgi:hypothetical protein